jgi:signal transduction histidine kinase
MRSLAVKLTLAFLIVGITGALLVAFFVGQRTQREFDRFLLDRYQTDLIDDLSAYYEQTGSWGGIAGVMAERWRMGPRRGVPITLLDQEQRVVFSRTHAKGEQLSSQDTKQELAVTVDGETVGWLLFDLPDPRRPPPDAPELGFLQRVRQAILFGALGAAAVALLLGIVLARTLTHPLSELTAATRALAGGALGQQVAIRSNDELGELGTAFNQMSTDLAKSVHLRRQMTADIAHDLRTPLSVILGYTEALSEGKFQGSPEIYTVLHDEAQHLNRLIDDLRTLSLADAGELPLHWERVAPGELLARAASAHRVQAEQKGIQLAVEAPPNLPAVHADPERMAQVLGNLVSNALRYTPVGGFIRLAAAAKEGGVALQVQDSGAGIAPDDLPYVFERFYRGDKARPQTGQSGLGLAIAKSLVEMQQGTLSVSSAPGHGTTFTIALPAA